MYNFDRTTVFFNNNQDTFTSRFGVLRYSKEREIERKKKKRESKRCDNMIEKGDKEWKCKKRYKGGKIVKESELYM